ncbi:hypothetical protein AMTRI_Chr13g86290 [Amborella trichopoda]
MITTPAKRSKGLLLAPITNVLEIPPMQDTKSCEEIPHVQIIESSSSSKDLDPKDISWFMQKHKRAIARDCTGKMLACMWLKFKGEVRIVEEVLARNPPPVGLVFDRKLRNSSQNSLSTLLLLVLQGPRGEVKPSSHDDSVVLERPGTRRHRKKKGVEMLGV